MTTSFPKPLAGRVILDMSLLYPGPYATLMLANFGARVIKIEPKQGDPILHLFRPVYDQLNRDKEIIRLDLKSPEDLAIFATLVKNADALVEGFRPGVMDRLNIGHSRLKKLNPKLVMTSISGFGATGPYSQHPAHDMSVLGVAGYFSLPSQLDNEITRPNIRLSDVLAAQTAAFSTVMGILTADQTGDGVHIDTSLFDATAAVSLQALLAQPNPDTAPEHQAQVMADSGIYTCSDGLKICISTLEDKFWSNFVSAVAPDCSALRDDCYATRQGRDKDKPALAGLLNDLFVSKTRTDWFALLKGVETAVSPVLRGAELLDEPHLAAREATGSVASDSSSMQYALFPARFDGLRESPTRHAEQSPTTIQRIRSEFQHKAE